ncbi:MAG: hypothetical protein GY756_05495 [bacterium]|nr:hypothetical protein [bacterium]
MRKTVSFVFTILILGLLAGCASTYINQPSSPLEITTKAEVKPIIQVGEKIEATATVSRIAYLFISGPGNFAEGVNFQSGYQEPNLSESFWGDTIAEAKAAAAYRACSENQADFIIAPRYYIIVQDFPFYRKTQARVFGYKGVLKGVEVPPVPKPYVPPTQKIQITNPISIAQPIKLDQPIMLKEPLQKNTKPATPKVNVSKKPADSLSTYVN